jgi:hypothetical protein
VSAVSAIADHVFSRNTCHVAEPWVLAVFCLSFQPAMHADHSLFENLIQLPSFVEFFERVAISRMNSFKFFIDLVRTCSVPVDHHLTTPIVTRRPSLALDLAVCHELDATDDFFTAFVRAILDMFRRRR